MPSIWIPAIGTDIYASVVFPGMILDLGDGDPFAVEEVHEGYDRWTFVNLSGEAAEVDYGALVTVLGYFNP
jgi:hypothetical protein